MKRKYVKPELYFENFELSTSIASCDDIVKGPISFGGKTFFVEKYTCTPPNADNDEGNICYHVSSPGHKMFAS